MAPNSQMSKSVIHGALATLSRKLNKDITLVVYGDIQAVLGSKGLEACWKSLEKIDYAVRFDSEIIDETAQKLEKHITEIASGASDKQLSDDWMTAINDVRMPFHLK